MTADPANATAAKEDGLYVYCVARGDGNHLFGPIGLDGQVVYTVGSGDIRAVVHNCQAEPYQSQDPQVVQGWVVAHQNVVLAAATEAFGTVLPMAFDMIVRGGPGQRRHRGDQGLAGRETRPICRLVGQACGQGRVRSPGALGSRGDRGIAGSERRRASHDARRSSRPSPRAWPTCFSRSWPRPSARRWKSRPTCSPRTSMPASADASKTSASTS